MAESKTAAEAAVKVTAAEKAAADARIAADKAAAEAASAPKSIEEHIDILRVAVRALISRDGPVTGDLEERFDISWPAKEAERIKAAVELAEAKLAHAKEAEKAAADKSEGESPREKAARIYRENAEAELAGLKGEAPTPKHSSPHAGKVAEEPYRGSSRSAKVIAALAIGAGLLMGMPQPGHAAGMFPGLPAATGPGVASTGAPTTGGGPVTAGGCIPMDTGNAQGINPATVCVSPSQLAAASAGVQLSYGTAKIDPAVSLATTGVDTTPVSGTIYLAQINIPLGFVVTNIACLNGSAAATNNLLYGLFNGSSGAFIAGTAVAGTLAANANTFQSIALTAPYTAALASGGYFIGWQTNGTTTRLRTIGANGVGDLTGSVVGTFSGSLPLPSITPPTTFTVNVGPICTVN